MLHVFMDESGDLGWSLDKLYRKGGSSRFLTLAFMVADQDETKHPKRLVKRFCQSHGMHAGHELKGCDLSAGQLQSFAERAAAMLEKHSSIRLCAITVNKQNVQDHIRKDSNKLYNYMLNLSLLEHVKYSPTVVLSPDARSIKVASGSSLVDYLQTQLWFEHNATTVLDHQPQESQKSLAIQFVDVVAHIVWGFHEDAKALPYKVLAPHMRIKHLFFN
jgi:hypothetical protein